MVEKTPLTFTFTIIAREMVRAFMGSIGLVCAIPLPVCIAAYLFYDKRNKSERMSPDNYSNVSPVRYFFSCRLVTITKVQIHVTVRCLFKIQGNLLF